MSEPGIKLSKRKITQTIDLNEVVGSDISSDEILVTKIGQAIIDYIDTRVEDGMGLGREKLKSPYSKSYSESLNFKAAGKSRSHVNMRLSNDMMAAIDIVEKKGAKITYGITDPEEAAKAYGHQTGFEGHPTIPEGKYKRPFFGVTKDEIKKYILDEFKDEINAKKVTSAEGIKKVIGELKGKLTLADLFEDF